VIFALLHGWRTFFQDRFRGPRWLAWISGILMAAFFWLIGISGYWMIWDQRAGVINQTLINLINNSPIGTAFLVNNLVTEAAGTGWIFILIVTTIHLGLSAVVALFYWLHIKRLSRPKWLPPHYWVAVFSGLLVIAAILIPVGMLAPIDPIQLPIDISTDLFFLFYLPAALNPQPFLFWVGVLLLVALFSAIPWILKGKHRPPIVVDPDRCTGCTLCAKDCPYKAIEMVERQDESRHKYLAKIDPKMCVACGICVGTCAPLAMTFENQPADNLWKETIRQISVERTEPIKVVFTCERHAFQGARADFHLETIPRKEGGPYVQIVPLTCIGMAHPDLATQALEAGAAQVQYIGCPPEDCANREGNVWLQARLDRARLPKLRLKFKDSPIFSDWLPPNEFKTGLRKPNQQGKATTYSLDFSQIQWHFFLPAILLLAIIFVFQIWLSDRPFKPYPENTALLEVALNHKAGYPVKGITTNQEPKLGLAHPSRLILEIDGNKILDQSYPPLGRDSISFAFEQIRLSPGDHHILLRLFDRPDQVEGSTLFDELVSIEKRGILSLSFRDAQISGDPLAGRDLFFESSLGASASCHICHAIEPGVDKVGPSLAGVATRAGESVPGMSAEAYLRESVVDPDAYIVEGYSAGLMLPDLEEKLSEEQIENLIAFLLTLK
jgi:ferredoxin/coenzyme F420-reducing hydrogenase delta subunit